MKYSPFQYVMAVGNQYAEMLQGRLFYQNTKAQKSVVSNTEVTNKSFITQGKYHHSTIPDFSFENNLCSNSLDFKLKKLGENNFYLGQTF